MLVVITSEENSDAEKMELLLLFENGLSHLHVRKPHLSYAALKRWLGSFKSEHLSKMVLHQHHGLADEFCVKGIHLKEGFRKEQKDLKEYIYRHKAKGCTVSSSFHNPKELPSPMAGFDYVFLSPVFTSLSKRGYQGKAFMVADASLPVIALGGITTDKIAQTSALGYAGIAVLGAIWLAEDKKEAFNKIKEGYHNVYC